MSLPTLIERLTGKIARRALGSCASVGPGPRVSGRLWIHGEGEVRVGARVFFDATNAPIELYPWPGAVIVFGDDVYVGGGTSIEATASIVFGDRVRIGSLCKIIDNHFHPLVGDRRARPEPEPVFVEHDVLLGPRSLVLAGARIPAGARFGAGSIVKRGNSAPSAVVIP